MKIKLGKLYENKTIKYILPKLRKYYDDMFITLLQSIPTLAVGVGDYLLQDKYKQHVFVLVDTKVNSKVFSNFIEYIKDKQYYETNYAFDNILTGRMQMIVFRLPDDIIDKFIEGQYSQLYPLEEALILVRDSDVFHVLVKHKDYEEKFIDKVEQEYGYRLLEHELDDRELDIPPNKEKEFFNYREPV